jgi:hypothetical protein
VEDNESRDVRWQGPRRSAERKQRSKETRVRVKRNNSVVFQDRSSIRGDSCHAATYMRDAGRGEQKLEACRKMVCWESAGGSSGRPGFVSWASHSAKQAGQG